eukprot:tig00000681_g3077.t1
MGAAQGAPSQALPGADRLIVDYLYPTLSNQLRPSDLEQLEQRWIDPAAAVAPLVNRQQQRQGQGGAVMWEGKVKSTTSSSNVRGVVQRLLASTAVLEPGALAALARFARDTVEADMQGRTLVDGFPPL